MASLSSELFVRYRIWLRWGYGSQIRSAILLAEGGERAAQVARDFGMSRATFYRRSRALDA
jgi:transcriptional regulator of acetoin/glycerol metabolism